MQECGPRRGCLRWPRGLLPTWGGHPLVIPAPACHSTLSAGPGQRSAWLSLYTCHFRPVNGCRSQGRSLAHCGSGLRRPCRSSAARRCALGDRSKDSPHRRKPPRVRSQPDVLLWTARVLGDRTAERNRSAGVRDTSPAERPGEQSRRGRPERSTAAARLYAGHGGSPSRRRRNCWQRVVRAGRTTFFHLPEG